MNTEIIDLYEKNNVPRNGATAGYLHAYVPNRSKETVKKTHPAIIICAGGAYRFLSDREDEPIALRFAVLGYCAFTLEYTVNAAYPVPLIEACMAAAYLREHADEYCISPTHIGVLGFSAGGNLAAMHATLFAEKEVQAALGAHAQYARPDAAVLCYLSRRHARHLHARRIVRGYNGRRQKVARPHFARKAGDKGQRARVYLAHV